MADDGPPSAPGLFHRHRTPLALVAAVAAALVAWSVAPAGPAAARPSLLAARVAPGAGHGGDARQARWPTTTTTTQPTTTTTAPPAAVPSPAPAAPTPAAAAPPTTVPAPAPAPAPALAPAPSAGLADPAVSLAPTPNFLQDCSGAVYDDSSGCVQATLAAIDHARATEGLGPMVLPADWASLTPAEQLFVATNLERTARGLAALTGMASELDQAAAAGAAAGEDPAPPSGYPFTRWGSNWAGALGNPLEAIYLWMYDDGPGSSNVDCPVAGDAGCWGHRHNILLPLSGPELLMGCAYDQTGWNGYPSWTEILAATWGQQSVDFSQ